MISLIWLLYLCRVPCAACTMRGTACVAPPQCRVLRWPLRQCVSLCWHSTLCWCAVPCWGASHHSGRSAKQYSDNSSTFETKYSLIFRQSKAVDPRRMAHELCAEIILMIEKHYGIAILFRCELCTCNYTLLVPLPVLPGFRDQACFCKLWRICW